MKEGSLMVDKTLILRKLAKLEEYLAQIREYSNVSAKEYSNNWKIQRITERTIQIMIETCLDISGHIISDEGFRIPDNYADTFRVLYENGILDGTLLKSMIKMAQFRNFVVHNYDKIDTSIVINILNNHLDDFISYKNAIVDKIEKSKA